MTEPLERLRAALAGRYAIEEEIGRGGMANVYRARDLRHARSVAIKMFRAGVVGSNDAALRFLQEIRIAAQLAHPHILPLHDSGEIAAQGDDPALLYYVMPYVGGQSLRERLRQEGRLPLDAALSIARTVALALEHAHSHNVLHRDVKPENILLQEGQAVVADFGVARAIEEAGCETLTLPGLAVGTPAYMSPEQASGQATLDGRSDQYALACVLFEMLAGQPPFAGAGARAIMTRQAQDPVPSLRGLRPEVSVTVEKAIEKALAKRPEDRFETVREFVEALVASSADTADQYLETVAARSVAVLPFVNASPDEGNEYFSDGMTDELIHLLANVEGLHVVPRTTVFAYKRQTEDVRAIGARLGGTTVLEGSVRKAGNRLRVMAQLIDVPNGRLLWSERFDRDDRDVFAIQEELARTIVSTLRANLLGTLGDPLPKRYTENLVAYNLYLRGRHSWNKRTQEGVNEAIRFFGRAIAEDPSYALAYTGLADAYALQLDYRAAPVAEGMRRAREMASKAIELDDGLAEAHTSLGWVQFIHDWDWEAAGRSFRRALECNPRYATARQWHSWYLAATGKLDEGVREARRAVALDPASLSIRRSLGWLYYFSRQLDVAAEHLLRAVPMNPDAHETHLILALVHLNRGDLDAADAALDETLALVPEDTGALAARARVAMLRGDRGAAQAVAARIQEIAGRRYVSPADIAKLHIALGDTERAFAAMEDAYAERRGWLAYLRIEPWLDPLRSDPRFATFLERLRLVEPVA